MGSEHGNERSTGLDTSQEDISLLTPIQKALYDPSLDTCWMEVAVSSSIYFPNKLHKKKYIYLYTLRIWDGNKVSESQS